MILINLLPPELRKKKSAGINATAIGLAAGALVCIGMLSFLLWIKMSRIPAAEARRDDAMAELQRAKDEIARIEQMEAEIAAFRKLSDTLLDLLSRKVYWAKTIDDFASLLSGRWQFNGQAVDGFEVRCLNFMVSPLGGTSSRSGAVTGIEYSIRASYRLVGLDRDLSGRYLSAFWDTTIKSQFWKDNGLQGAPEDTYRGDTPRWEAGIKRVVVDLPLEFRRIKTISDSKRGK